MTGLSIGETNIVLIIWLSESSTKITKIKLRDMRQFSCVTATKTCFLEIIAIPWKNRPVSPRLKNYEMKNRILKWLNEIIWMIKWNYMNDWMITELLSTRKQEWSNLKPNLSRASVLLWRIFVRFIFLLKNHKTADSAKIYLAVCRVVRYRER